MIKAVHYTNPSTGEVLVLDPADVTILRDDPCTCPDARGEL